MTEDEEIVLRGSALYDYLCNSGYSNFESIEVNPSEGLSPIYEDAGTLHISAVAPKWASDHIWCILKCGLVLEDHQHFVECYLPLQTHLEHSFRSTMVLSSLSFATAIASTVYVLRHHFLTKEVLSVGVLSFIGALWLSKKALSEHKHSLSLHMLRLMLTSLEELYVQFKRMIFLVQQNELIARSFSLRRSEMMELRRCVWNGLYSSIKDMYDFFVTVKKIPLNQNVDQSLHSFSLEDISCVPGSANESELSMESLKKLYNTYVLLQSEYLRRLALCFCPELWSSDTAWHTLQYSQKYFLKIQRWSGNLRKSLVQEYKLFRAIGGSRGKQTQLKISGTPGWDFADLYVGVRSASVHLQSLLVQNQEVEDILESKDSVNWKRNKDFLSSIVHILTDIKKELHSCQACFDDCLVQVLRVANESETKTKLIPLEASRSSLEPGGTQRPDSELNPPVEDEVFELLVPLEAHLEIIDDSDTEEGSALHREKKAQEREASKKVLEELKFVLVKKASEWRDRERRAMESKGMVFSAAEDVASLRKASEETSSPPSDLHWLPTDGDNVWPLPRLKEAIPAPRHAVEANQGKHESNHTRRGGLEAQLRQADLRQAREKEMVQNHLGPRIGIGGSMLAEAMAKSSAMNMPMEEELFLDDEEDLS